MAFLPPKGAVSPQKSAFKKMLGPRPPVAPPPTVPRKKIPGPTEDDDMGPRPTGPLTQAPPQRRVPITYRPRSY